MFRYVLIGSFIGAYCSRIVIRQLSIVATSSMRHSSFVSRIAQIVGLCPEKQVARINTGRHITFM